MKVRSLLIMLFMLLSATAFAQTSVKEAEEFDFAQGLLSRGMYGMAISQYQKFIAAYPQSPSVQDAYLSIGEGYFLSHDLSKAIEAFTHFNQLFPNSDKLPVSVLRLGQIDIEQKKYDDALKELTSIDAEKSLKGRMLQTFDYYLGEAYRAKSDPASALGYFQKAAQVEGGDNNDAADAFNEIGAIESKDGHYPEALEAYGKALPLTDDKTLKGELKYRIAEVQFLSGKYSDAITGFQEVIAAAPNAEITQNAMSNLLLAYFNMSQYDQLIKTYQQFGTQIKDEASYLPIHRAAVLGYIELKQYDQANALLERMLAVNVLSPKDRAAIYVKKADILTRQKKYKDAMALLEAYAAQDPEDTDEADFLKAQCYFGLEDYDHAFNFFENVYLNFPNSRFAKAALLGQAHARQKAGRFKEAEGLFSKYIGVQDQADLKSEALYDAVMMAEKAGDIHGAISTAEQFLKEFPSQEHSGQVLLILADDYGKNNQAGEAVKLLQGYLAGPKAAERPNAANFLLGYNLQLLGKSAESLAAYKLVDQNKDEGKFYFAALKNMAIIYLTQKDFEQARSYFDSLISATPDNNLGVKTYIWVCNEYLKLRKYGDVQRIAAQAEKRFTAKDLREIKYFEAEALRGLDKCDEAGKIYDELTTPAEKDVYSGSAHIGRGLCLVESKKYDEARTEFQKSLDENPDDYTVTAHARFEIANADAAQGKDEEAVKFYLLVATIYDNEHYCSESLLQAGRVSERLHRADDAVKFYKELLEKYAGTPAAQTAKERLGQIK